jgi:hypothetical protein
MKKKTTRPKSKRKLDPIERALIAAASMPVPEARKVVTRLLVQLREEEEQAAVRRLNTRSQKRKRNRYLRALRLTGNCRHAMRVARADGLELSLWRFYFPEFEKECHNAYWESWVYKVDEAVLFHRIKTGKRGKDGRIVHGPPPAVIPKFKPWQKIDRGAPMPWLEKDSQLLKLLRDDVDGQTAAKMLGVTPESYYVIKHRMLRELKRRQREVFNMFNMAANS